MSISTVISYCTNDYRFLGKCIEEASHFSKEIIVPVCDHFFNGKPESRELLNATYAQFPQVKFFEFPYSHERLHPSYIGLKSEDKDWTAHWNSLARLLGFFQASGDWILFLDTDEITEGKRFKESFERGVFDEYNAVRLACYYYVLKPWIRATLIQDLTLFVRKKCLHASSFFQPEERYGMFSRVEGKKQTEMRGFDQKPLIHHYSWVRPEKEACHKVDTWSHRMDKDWQSVVQDLFHGKGLNALFGTEVGFEEAPVYFDPLEVPPPAALRQNNFPNLQKCTMRDFQRWEFEWESALM